MNNYKLSNNKYSVQIVYEFAVSRRRLCDNPFAKRGEQISKIVYHNYYVFEVNKQKHKRNTILIKFPFSSCVPAGPGT